MSSGRQRVVAAFAAAVITWTVSMGTVAAESPDAAVANSPTGNVTPAYVVRPLPLPVGGVAASVIAVSPRGVVTGIARYPDGTSHPVVWRPPYVVGLDIAPPTWFAQPLLQAAPVDVDDRGDVLVRLDRYDGLPRPTLQSTSYGVIDSSEAYHPLPNWRDGRQLVPEAIYGAHVYGGFVPGPYLPRPMDYDWRTGTLRLPVPRCVRTDPGFVDVSSRGVPMGMTLNFPGSRPYLTIGGRTVIAPFERKHFVPGLAWTRINSHNGVAGAEGGTIDTRSRIVVWDHGRFWSIAAPKGTVLQGGPVGFSNDDAIAINAFDLAEGYKVMLTWRGRLTDLNELITGKPIGPLTGALAAGMDDAQDVFGDLGAGGLPGFGSALAFVASPLHAPPPQPAPRHVHRMPPQHDVCWPLS